MSLIKGIERPITVRAKYRNFEGIDCEIELLATNWDMVVANNEDFTPGPTTVDLRNARLVTKALSYRAEPPKSQGSAIWPDIDKKKRRAGRMW